jgi:hypothetical protein
MLQFTSALQLGPFALCDSGVVSATERRNLKFESVRRGGSNRNGVTAFHYLLESSRNAVVTVHIGSIRTL